MKDEARCEVVASLQPSALLPSPVLEIACDAPVPNPEFHLLLKPNVADPKLPDDVQRYAVELHDDPGESDVEREPD